VALVGGEHGLGYTKWNWIGRLQEHQ